MPMELNGKTFLYFRVYLVMNMKEERAGYIYIYIFFTLEN